MEKIQSFQITDMRIAGFKSYREPTQLVFGNPTVPHQIREPEPGGNGAVGTENPGAGGEKETL